MAIPPRLSDFDLHSRPITPRDAIERSTLIAQIKHECRAMSLEQFAARVLDQERQTTRALWALEGLLLVAEARNDLLTEQIDELKGRIADLEAN